MARITIAALNYAVVRGTLCTAISAEEEQDDYLKSSKSVLFLVEE